MSNFYCILHCKGDEAEPFLDAISKQGIQQVHQVLLRDFRLPEQDIKENFEPLVQRKEMHEPGWCSYYCDNALTTWHSRRGELLFYLEA